MLRYLAILLFALLACPVEAQISGGGTVFRIGSVGTWTPAVTASSTAGTPTYTTAVGSYVKVGNYIYAQFDIVLSGWTGSPSGNVTITGLPFTATATASDNGGCDVTQYTVSGLTASNFGITGIIAPSATVVNLLEQGNAGTANVTAALTGTTPTLIGFCNYHM
jgi:hypothetical protein